MATYYVGAGGNNSNDGLSWAQRKLTLNGAEDIPVAAGDTVYVGAGTYRETLTCDVSGTAEAGSITYIGDYDGSHTDGIGGVVRITGSDDDITATRQYVVLINKNYRTFKNFQLDMSTGSNIYVASNGISNITIENIHAIDGGTSIEVYNNNQTITNLSITNCFLNRAYILYGAGAVGLATTNAVISNCIFLGSNINNNVNDAGVTLARHKDIVVKNCLFYHSTTGVKVAFTDSPNFVYNCIFDNCYYGIVGEDTGDVTEDYNSFWKCNTARSNTNTGANSLAYALLPDSRWFFEMVNGGSMITPFDLSSASKIINVAGTSPTTADMRGTTVQGTQREWGALEYDSTLDIEAGSGGGGGAVSIQPISGRVSL